MTGVEAILEPDLPIIDPHHHLWILHGEKYLIDEFRGDLESGHKVVATAYVECGSMYRNDGPPTLRAVGEAEFVAGVASMSERGLLGRTHMCAAFVGAADLMLGAEVDGVLEALQAGSGGRLRGVRGVSNWDADPATNTGNRPFAPEGLMRDACFRSGVARLDKYKLTFDSWNYHPQLPDLCSLADAFPDTPVISNHCGGLIRTGRYADGEAMNRWRDLVAEAARRPNIFMKLGGIARRCNVVYSDKPAAQELADAWRPYMETCIEFFGPERCMFESNYPPDKYAGSYRTIWNAFKLIARDYSSSEKAHLFSRTAARVYSIK